MKSIFSLLVVLIVFYALLPYQALAQPNQLVNGNFDNQYIGGAPTQELNIKNTSPGYGDELPNWLTTTNISASTSNNATYVATNSTAPYPLNPTQDNDAYTPHSGIGCVLLLGDHFHKFDGIITQKVSLTAGHTYTFSYYAKRLAYSDQKAKLAFSIVYSSAVPGHNADPTVNDLVPTPSVRKRSDFITLNQWIQISDTFIAPTTSANAWVTLGFDNSESQTDANLPPSVNSGTSIHLVLDDVSLVDNGCLNPTITYGFDFDADRVCADKTVYFRLSDEDRANNPGATFAFSTSGSNYVRIAATAPYDFAIKVRNQSIFNVSVQATSSCGLVGPIYTQGPFSGSGFLQDCLNGSYAQAPMTATAKAYPNPTAESLTLPTEAKQLVLLNSQGHVVQPNISDGKLDVRSLPAGLYNLQMYQNGTLVNQRIEVRH